MKKIFRKSLLLLIILIMSISPTMAGCFSVNSLKIDTPEMTLHSESYCVSWNWVKNTKNYEIYCNDEYVETISSDITKQSYIYDFTKLLTEIGEYKFYIVAIANSSFNEDSDKSNEVTYNCTAIPESALPEDTTVETTPEQTTKTVGIAINGTRVDIALMKNYEVDGYELYLYSQSTGLNVYPIDVEANRNSDENYSVSIELLSSTYNLQDEIYAVRVGYVEDGQHIVCSDIRYVNPDNYPFFCSDIYLFDGYINDMYLESIQELRNLVYYSFINRDSEVSVKISKPLQKIINLYTGINGTDFKSKLLDAVAESFDYFLETRDGYDISITTMSITDAQYSIQIGYNEFLNSSQKPEPELTYIPPYYYYEEIEWDTFYDTCGYTMRANDAKYSESAYDNFASDKQFLYTNVSSSEQLYWAVENKITPHCEKGSRAETIYKLAKQTLNEIISDEMTDYEKALSIFDWICANTSYDYYAITEGAYQGNATLVPVYYLEGVFLTGYAVCDGFSKAYSLMCNMEGIDAVRIVGHASGGGHAWNKVGLDLDSKIAGKEYYVVDITWTEIKALSQYSQGYAYGFEVTAHEYFLVNDDYIASTHTVYEHREKYSRYVTSDRYDYYDKTTFTFDGSQYGLDMASNNTTFDLVIENEDDLTAMFYYMLVNSKQSMEFMFDFDFLSKVDIDAGGSGTISSGTMFSNLTTLMKSKKFLSQYLFLNNNSQITTVYNSGGEIGLIMVLENNLLIDDANEVGHLVEFLSHYQVYGTYELYIDSTILNSISGNNLLAKAQNLFKTALNNSNINMTFTLLQSTAVSAGDGKSQYYYSVTVSPKSS